MIELIIALLIIVNFLIQLKVTKSQKKFNDCQVKINDLLIERIKAVSKITELIK